MAAINPEVETFQNDWELEQLLFAVDNLVPSSILEVGAWHGGTLWHWLHLSERVVVVDDEMRRESDWYRWAHDTGTPLTLLRGLSTQKRVIYEAADNGPYDFLFIDADHTYDSVRSDWDNYSPLVRE